MTNGYEPAKLHENVSPSQKAHRQEQIGENGNLKRENFWLVLEWTIYQNKNIKMKYSSA